MPDQQGRWRPTLGLQVALLTTLVTIVAVAVSFVISASLVRTAAEQEARRTLGHYAQLIADRPPATGVKAPGARALYQVARIRPMRVAPDGAVTGAPAVAAQLPASVTRAAAAGRPVNTVLPVNGHQFFVQARPLADGDGSIVLAQPETATGTLLGPLRARLVVALLVGLGVAVTAGLVMSRRLTRPLRLAAAAASRLARGERTVRVTVEGPAEVAEVGGSINALAAALATSEDRQRTFLLSVSHELRTPLTTLRGYAEGLADGVVPPSESPAVGATMLHEARRLDRLVSDLLDLARLGADDFGIEPGDVDLADLLRRAARVWTDRCSRVGVPLQCEIPGAPVPARTDAGRVRQIVDGLLENALRVTPEGAPIVLALSRSGAHAQIEVRDGGPGLTDDDLTVAFHRSALYERYRGVRRVGTGVGLALIAGLATRLGGAVTAGHAPEGGARFTVTLPSAPGTPGSPVTAGPSDLDETRT